MSQEKQVTPIEADTLLIVTDDEYSSYGIVGVARALRQFGSQALAAEYEAKEGKNANTSGFLLFLEINGCVKEVAYRELWGNQEWNGQCRAWQLVTDA